MASQSLYRKWRSQTFDDLVGQEPIVRTLKNALSGGKLAHAYLFTGPRGTGKTTTARLLAKTINCSNPKNGEPCNQCQQCREITAGNSFNVIEIDAASNRGIDSIRDLREKVLMPPSTGKYKVYVLDEAHMLTPEAFNALLKTLEEPPPYAVFVLATTDVHKMLPTVLSRCQRFDFKRFSTRQIVEHLYFVAGQEHVKLEQAAAELIARAAAGGMRDALSLLDQAIAYSGEEISLLQVQAMLGVADPHAISRFINHIANLDSSGGLHLIHELSEAGADLHQVNAQVVEYWRSLMLARAGADIASILDLTEDEMREIKQICQLFGLEELTECARLFAQNELVQKNAGTPQLGLELAFLECIEVHRRAQSGQIARQVLPAFADTPAGIDTLSAALASAELPAMQDGSSQPTLTLQQVKAAWDNVKRRVKVKDKEIGPKLAAYLNDFSVVGVEDSAEQPIILIQAAHSPHYKYVRENERHKEVEWALALEFKLKDCRVRLLPPGQPLPIASARDAATYSANTTMQTAPQQSARLERPSVASASPSKQVEQEEVSPQATVEQRARQDPIVQEAMRTFMADIVEVRQK